jgi:hypothetical protein
MAVTRIELTTQVKGILPVANGGLGLSTLTANLLYVGNGSSAPIPIAIGTSGQVLTSAGAGLAPTFQAVGVGALTNTHLFVGNGSNVATDVAASGDVTLANTGAFTVATVGASTAANIHSAELAANAATNLNTVSTIVKRDSSGNFVAGTITAALTGNASTATTATTATTANALAATDAAGQSAIVAINDATSGTINGARINVQFMETPTGTINGSNATFTLANTPSGAIALFLNGVGQHVGASNDFTISGLTITMLNVPITGDFLEASYKY